MHIRCLMVCLSEEIRFFYMNYSSLLVPLFLVLLIVLCQIDLLVFLHNDLVKIIGTIARKMLLLCAKT